MILLALITLLIAGGVGYQYYREGLLAAFAACVSVIISGMVAFQLWPMIANELEPAVLSTIFQGMEDAIALTVVFAACVAVLRLGTGYIVNRELAYSDPVNRAGGAVFGAIAGYFAAGFALCVVQTLPLYNNFLGFEVPKEQEFVSRFVPADQNWLKLMERSQRGPFRNTEEPPYSFKTFTYDFGTSRRGPDPNVTQPDPTTQPPPNVPTKGTPKKKKPIEPQEKKGEDETEKNDE